MEQQELSLNKKPPCKLIGEDGNAFSIIGRVNKALKKYGLMKQSKEFTRKAFECRSYDELLILAVEYTEIE